LQELPLLIRSLYQTPTEEELEKWSKQIDPQGKGVFEFSAFLALMAKYFSTKDSEYKEP
jgi:Ca2+-binding EF-hand superfamily protein